MTKPNPVNYQLAAERIAARDWTVDADAGVVYGVRGRAFRRTNTDGYIQIKFRDPNNWRQEHAALAHRVIWESVHGPLADGLTINHINGDKTDNRIANLEAVTMLANIQHARDTGLLRPHRGEEAARSQLTNTQVREIYRRAWTGENQTRIGADYGVGREIVSNIKHGYAWTHITGHRRGVA